MLQDVIEMRKNKWVPRSRQITSLKTIDQVHTTIEIPLLSVNSLLMIACMLCACIKAAEQKAANQ